MSHMGKGAEWTESREHIRLPLFGKSFLRRVGSEREVYPGKRTFLQILTRCPCVAATTHPGSEI
ncbi:MAG: hypothetical protein RLZZ232_2845 [Planctomycetota bacterium]|jgi:hypothetical protein